MVKQLGMSALSLEKLTWASRYAEPIDPLPGPAAREALRRECGIPRHVVATVIGASYTPFIRAEQGQTYRSKIPNSVPYLRILGYMSRLVVDQYGKQRLEEILNTPDKEPDHAAG